MGSGPGLQQEEAVSSADTREGKVHLLLQRDPRLWQG